MIGYQWIAAPNPRHRSPCEKPQIVQMHTDEETPLFRDCPRRTRSIIGHDR